MIGDTDALSAFAREWGAVSSRARAAVAGSLAVEFADAADVRDVSADGADALGMERRGNIYRDLGEGQRALSRLLAALAVTADAESDAAYGEDAR